MFDENTKPTLGKTYLLDLEKTQTKGMIFLVLTELVANTYSSYDILSQTNKLSDFDSVAIYQDKIARVKIEYNSQLATKLSNKLIELNSSNYKDKEKVAKKLNFLINNNPTIVEIIYIAIAFYINQGYGKTEDFKKDITNYVKGK